MSKEKLTNELVETIKTLDTKADYALLRMVTQRLLQKYEVKEIFTKLIAGSPLL